jgi:hypothetical protein
MLGMGRNYFYSVLILFILLGISFDTLAQRAPLGAKRHVLRKGRYVYSNDPTFLHRVYKRIKEISFQCRYDFYPCRSDLGETCLGGSGMFLHYEYEHADYDYLKLGLMNVSWNRFPSAFILDYQYAPVQKVHGFEFKMQQYFLPVNRIYLFAAGVSLDAEFRKGNFLVNAKPYIGLTLPIRALSQLQFSYGYNFPLQGSTSGFNSFCIDWKSPLFFF